MLELTGSRTEKRKSEEMRAIEKLVPIVVAVAVLATAPGLGAAGLTPAEA